MSAPYPDNAQAPSFEAPREAAREIPERGTFVPSFYSPATHPNPESIRVGERVNGVFHPFVPGWTVADIAPEYRWVVDSEGALIHQTDFENRFKQWRRESFRFHGAKVPQGWSDAFEPIPSLRKVSRLTIDPTNPRRLRDVHYDPHKTAGAVPEVFVNNDGEPVGRARIDVLVEAYRDPAIRPRLRENEVKEVEAHLAKTGNGKGSAGEVLGKMELLLELLHSGVLSQPEFVERCEALGSAPEAAQPPKPVRKERKDRPSKELVTLPCGKELIGNRGKKFHVRSCQVCQDAGV